jgi:hypothetical protein
MLEIYSHPLLTIIAGGSSAVTAGILQDRQAEVSCQLPWRRASPSEGKPDKIFQIQEQLPEKIVHIRVAQRGGFRISDEMQMLEKLQWASRGWTFQEHLLS